MKLLTLLSATIISLTCLSIESKAQSDLKLFPDQNNPISGLQGHVDSIRIFRPVDSSRYLPDSNKFVRKPNYNAYNQPLALPNAFKAAQSTAMPMPLYKIPLSSPESKKD